MSLPSRVLTHCPGAHRISPSGERVTDPKRVGAQYTSPSRSLVHGPAPQIVCPHRSFRHAACAGTAQQATSNASVRVTAIFIIAASLRDYHRARTGVPQHVYRLCAADGIGDVPAGAAGTAIA